MVILNVNLTSQLQSQNGYSSAIITKEANNNEITHFSRETNQINETPIQSFYSGQCIFITGGTGFLGKILLEKLLRSCRNLEKIYLLVRPKKEKNIEERMEDLFANSVFKLLREEFPKFHHKIFPIAGDCCSPALGISLIDRETLIRDVSIVFHVAATVRFDEKLKLASAINIKSTADVIELCKSMQKLKSFIHVSTAYSNCHELKISEEFYNYSVKHDSFLKVIDCLPENIVDDITPRLIQPWPNTYTFTKAIAEDLIKEKNKGLPMGIFRPAIVVSTAKEPVPGWIDNLYGPTGVIVGATSGVLRTVLGNPNANANIVPVDYTVNALIASAWDVANQTNRRDEDMLIYNFVSNVDAPITWDEFRIMNLMIAKKYPMNNSIWYTSFRFSKNKFMSNFSILLLHLLPGLLIDTACRCVGQKPRLWNTYKKVHKFCNVLSHFILNDWAFSNENTHGLWTRLSPKDRQLYYFSLEGFDWNEYFDDYIKGVRTYLFKEDLSTLEQSRSKQKRLHALHLAVKTLAVTLGFWFLWSLITRFT